jgi:DNA-binding transcriptional LysR family regulator
MFACVAEESSFSRAARRLGIAKGTVSRGIARLEGIVGAELLHRTTHEVALSTAGVALYERTAPHLLALRDAVSKLPERESRPSGTLRITAPYDLGVIWLPELLARFSLRHPAVHVDVRLENRNVDLVAEGFDLAIRAAGALKDSSLSVRRLTRIEVRCYAAPAYLLRRGEPRSYGDPQHDWVAFGSAAKLSPLPRGTHPILTSNDFLLCRELLRQGTGIGILPAFVAEPAVREGALVQVLPKLRIGGVDGFVLLYPSSGQVPKKVAAFRDFVLEALRARPLGG